MLSFRQFIAYPTHLPLPILLNSYTPQYYLIKQSTKPANEDFMLIDNSYYAVLPDPNTIYYLYNSIRLFYLNGGGDAYIVSVGSYGSPSGKPVNVGNQIVNPNVKLSDLTNGLHILLNDEEPTMYICPEATLLSVAENGTLMEEMLSQSNKMQTAICVFDIIGGRNPDPILYTNDIQTFRSNTGPNGLSYGTAYYPFVGTTIVQSQEIDYTNFFEGDVRQLAPLLNPAENPNQSAAAILAEIANPQSTPLTVAQYNNALINASKTYSTILKYVLTQVNILPPSGGMAGVMTRIDNANGVWQAPANTSITGVESMPIKLSESQQANLNMDAISGKSINAIRFFNGLGILVWGARTLDGNSLDWRYLSVRRTAIMLEQSCKQAAQMYIFQPNTKNTWEAVKAMISGFLTNIWKEGGLQGASASDAFSVACGLGITMTADDILNGFMNVTIKLAIVRPAEYIVITFQQQMAAAQ